MADKPTHAEQARIIELHRKAMTAWIMSDWSDKVAEQRMEKLYAIMQGWNE